MFFQVLGPPGVAVGGDWYGISAKRQRALFVLLALSANRLLTREAIVEAIWGEHEPQHPEAAVHIIVSRLRNALGPAAARIVSLRSGYRLDVAADELDVTVAQTSFIRGRTLLLDNEPQCAVDVLTRALADWTEDPLAEIAQLPFCASAELQLAELRSSIEDLRNDALLAAGRHIEVLACVQAQISAHPWNEKLRSQLMIALYRSGRHIEALQEHEQFRALLIEEFGSEPSTELQELHLRILDHDSSLNLEKPGISLPIPPWTSTETPFVGRGREEEFVFSRLRDIIHGGQRMIVVEGDPGIGKTRFVMEIARRLSDNAIVLACTGNDVTRSAVLVLADALAAASEQLTDNELRVCLGRWPDELAAALPSLGRRFPNVQTPPDLDDGVRADRLHEGVTSWIIELSHRAPIVLMLDDVQRAGPGLLTLLGRLFARSKHKRVLVLATARTRSSDHSSRLEQLLTSLRSHDVLDRLELRGLDYESVERLVVQLGVPRPRETARVIHEHTDGLPFFVRELLRDEVLDTYGVPRTVREFVRARVRNLGASEQRTIEFASGFVTGFDIALLAEVAQLPEIVAAAHVTRAIDAGILREVQVRLFTFVHELTRRSVLETLASDQSAEIHRRIALALERRGAGAALLAVHWGKARGEDAIAKTYDDALTAGCEALHSIEPHAAVRWFRVALDAACNDAQQGRAYLKLAEAQHQTGDAECTEALRAAIARATRTHDQELLTQCATVWAPVWSSLPPLEGEERISLLERAREASKNVETKARLTARLATELLHTGVQDRVVELANEALTLGEQLSNPTKAEVAMRYAHATWWPGTVVQRRRLLEEAVLSLNRNDPMNRCFALSLAASTALEQADRECADAAIDEMLQLAACYDVLALSVNAKTTRALRCALDGQLRDANSFAGEALQLATGGGATTAAEGAILQLAFIAWHRGRFADLLPMIEQVDADRIGDVTKRVLVARCLAVSDRDAGRAVFDSIATNDLENLAHDMLWSVTLVFAAEVTFMLGASRIASTVHELLEPFRGQFAVANFVLAPIAYGAGLAAATAGLNDYDSLFANAVELSSTLRAPVLRKRAEKAWTLAREACQHPPAHGSGIDTRLPCLDLTTAELAEGPTPLSRA